MDNLSAYELFWSEEIVNQAYSNNGAAANLHISCIGFDKRLNLLLSKHSQSDCRNKYLPLY